MNSDTVDRENLVTRDRGYRQHMLLRLTKVVTGALLGFAIASQLPIWAVQLGNGATAFTSPPRLVDFVTRENARARKNATYYVTVNVLPEAGEPLKTLQVSLIEGRFTRLDYRTNDIEVFGEVPGQSRIDYSVASAAYDEESQTLTIQLAEAAPPGQVLTFVLELARNPTREGVYLFEVIAAPAGEQPVSQRIGIGRIHIYQESHPDYL